MSVSKNLFDGQGGNSDGTADGTSQGVSITTITGENVTIIALPPKVNVSVSGTFDGANVTLQKWLYGEWVSLDDAVWRRSRVLEDLPVEVGTAYRFLIDSAGASTDIKAGVSY